MKFREKFENLLEKITPSSFTFKDFLSIEEYPGNEDVKNIEDVDDLELFVRINERLIDIIYEFVDKWQRKEIIPDSQEIEGIRLLGGWGGGEYILGMTSLVESNNKLLEFSGKKQRLENVIKKRKEISNKIIAVFVEREKAHFQSNPNNKNSTSQTTSLWNQTQFNQKEDYPWLIIISMGAIIAFLLGAIIFLLVKNKKKVKL